MVLSRIIPAWRLDSTLGGGLLSILRLACFEKMPEDGFEESLEESLEDGFGSGSGRAPSVRFENEPSRESVNREKNIFKYHLNNN